MWVKMRRTRIEHMSAGLPPITDIARRGWNGRKVPGTDIASTFALTGERYNIVQGCQRDTRPWRGYSEVFALHAHL